MNKSHKQDESLIANNKKAFYNFQIDEQYEAGIALTGSEVKSIRQRKCTISESYCEISSGEMWVLNMHISALECAGWTNHAERRKRKLLLHKREIIKIASTLKIAGFAAVPIRVYFKSGFAKMTIGVGQGKKQHDKRYAIKEAEDKRAAMRAIKQRSLLGD